MGTRWPHKPVTEGSNPSTATNLKAVRLDSNRFLLYIWIMGRFKLISSPEMMWGLFDDYKRWVSDNPIEIEDYVGKDAIRVMRQKPRPLTMEGFECFVMSNTDLTYPDLSHYFSNRDDAYADFVAICSRIKHEIRHDQISGGMAGIYNPSITQRLNGLVDKTESKINIEQPLFGDE